MSKKLCLFLFLCFAGICLYAVRLTVLNTTDLHGNITGRYQGILRIAYLIGEQKKLCPADSLLLIDCGDTILGTFSSAVFQGELMIKCLNFLKYDVWVPGNHEFDYGLPVLKKRMREFSGAVLAANIDSPYLAKVHAAWKMFTRNGVKIAVIGMTMPEMSRTILVTDKTFETVSFAAAMKRVMPEIRAAKPDIIILAQHQGIYGKGFSLYKFTAQYPEIELILGAHTHQNNPGQKIGQNAWYFQAGKYACGLGRIIIDYDEIRHRIVGISSEMIPVTVDTPADRKLQERIRPGLKRAEKLAEQKIATITFKNTEKLDSSFIEQRIIGRMMLEQTHADVAICNAYPSKYKLVGTVPITLKKLYYWNRFADTVCTLTLEKSDYEKVMVEQKKLLKKNYRTIITYADKTSFAKKDRITAAFSSYALAGAGGKFPFLRAAAMNKKNLLKNTNIVIRDGLKSYLYGKEFTVSCEPDGEILVKRYIAIPRSD